MKLSLALAGASLLGRAVAELPPIETKVRIALLRLRAPLDTDEEQGSKFFYSNNGTEL